MNYRECDRELFETAQSYYIARIEAAQPDADPKLYAALGEIAFALNQLSVKELHG